MTSEALDDIAGDLEIRFAAADDAPLSEDDFNALALRVFAFQCEANPVYRAFAAGRGATPDRVSSWRDVPAVPAAAFRHLALSTGDPGAAEAVFRTSGTTRGPARGRHYVQRLSLYRASLLPTFRWALLPDRATMPFLSLVPSPESAPDSSLSWMVGAAAAELADGVSWLVDGEGRLGTDALIASLGEHAERDVPVLLAGTAFAFVHLLDALRREARSVARLPEGSRIMETGGFKGRARSVGRDELYRELTRATGVPDERIVNEYGMTELLSQLYERVITGGPEARGVHVPAPWLRVRALDPGTLGEVAAGEVGLLAFFDLANAGSVSHVLTEDMGSVVPGEGVRLVGRVEGAEPRGCSRAIDELMAAAGGRT